MYPTVHFFPSPSPQLLIPPHPLSPSLTWTARGYDAVFAIAAGHAAAASVQEAWASWVDPDTGFGGGVAELPVSAEKGGLLLHATLPA